MTESLRIDRKYCLLTVLIRGETEVNINDLLGRTIDCSCGRKHFCEIKKVIIEDGALRHLPDLTKEYRKILVVCDANTYRVCGKRVFEMLGEGKAGLFVYETAGFLIPNKEAIEALKERVTDETDLMIGVGSGVINDLCKYVSFLKKLPYFIVATAPSMDGYASIGAAMILNNMKITCSAHVPEVIIGDAGILRNAPMDMIKSGYGDILGKFSCLNDWKLSALVNGEYFCDYVYGLTDEMLMRTKDLGQKLLSRDREAVQTLMEALVGVGIAMAYTGNSRPASGSEHHMAHFFEVVGIMKDEPYFLHGIDVAYSAVCTQMLREELLKLDEPKEGYRPGKAEYEEKMREVYGDAAEGIIALQNRLGWYAKNYIGIYAEKWREMKEILAEAPCSGELTAYLESVGLDLGDFEKQYGKEKIQNAVWFAKDLKDRYTVLWLYDLLFYGSRK